jgi:hypothetical protein
MKRFDIVSNRRYLKCLIELKRSVVVVVAVAVAAAAVVVVVVQLGLVYVLAQIVSYKDSTGT